MVGVARKASPTSGKRGDSLGFFGYGNQNSKGIDLQGRVAGGGGGAAKRKASPPREADLRNVCVYGQGTIWSGWPTSCLRTSGSPLSWWHTEGPKFSPWCPKWKGSWLEGDVTDHSHGQAEETILNCRGPRFNRKQLPMFLCPWRARKAPCHCYREQSDTSTTTGKMLPPRPRAISRRT